MSLLKRIGAVALQATSILIGVGPLVAMGNPKLAGVVQRVVSDAEQLSSIIQQVEMFGQVLGLPGAQKLQMASVAGAQVILQSAALTGHKVAKPDLFKQGVSKVMDGWADIQNSLDDGGLKTEDKT